MMLLPWSRRGWCLALLLGGALAGCKTADVKDASTESVLSDAVEKIEREAWLKVCKKAQNDLPDETNKVLLELTGLDTSKPPTASCEDAYEPMALVFINVQSGNKNAK